MRWQIQCWDATTHHMDAIQQCSLLYTHHSSWYCIHSRHLQCCKPADSTSNAQTKTAAASSSLRFARSPVIVIGTNHNNCQVAAVAKHAVGKHSVQQAAKQKPTAYLYCMSERHNNVPNSRLGSTAWCNRTAKCKHLMKTSKTHQGDASSEINRTIAISKHALCQA
jgi:hypothetical protein